MALVIRYKEKIRASSSATAYDSESHEEMASIALDAAEKPIGRPRPRVVADGAGRADLRAAARSASVASVASAYLSWR